MPTVRILHRMRAGKTQILDSRAVAACDWAATMSNYTGSTLETSLGPEGQASLGDAPALGIGPMVALKGLSMEKWLCWGSIGVAGLLLLLFLLDLFTKFPFQGISPTVDVMGAICCAVLGYLGWSALQDLG
jgi:hypothetical protein